MNTTKLLQRLLFLLLLQTQSVLSQLRRPDHIVVIPRFFVSATKLTAAIPATDIGVAGTVQVTVFTPAPGGGTSSAKTFTINNPGVPAISSLSPASANAGGAAFTLTGQGFWTVEGPNVKVPIHATNMDGAGNPDNGPCALPGDSGYSPLWATGGGG
jgi:hypothetical protein